MTIDLTILVVLAMAFAFGLVVGQRKTWGIRQRIRERREPTRETLLSWLDQAPMGWIILDRNNTVRFINGRADKFLQSPTAQSPPITLGESSRTKTLIELAESVREHQQPQRIEWDFDNQELEVFVFSGENRYVAILLQSRRSLQEQLSQQERWVSDVAHELKTPLTALLLVADSLAARVTNQNAVLVERLLKELHRMQDLVGDLLELSRLENVVPGQGIKLERIALVDLLRESWQDLGPLAEEKNVGILFQVEHNNEGQPVWGDRKRLHRALLNLFDNALRHSPEHGHIHVDLQCSSDWVRCGIRDEGAGLSAQDLTHMFERFYRGDASRFRQHRGGSGLGLAIVQQIVLAHGGLIFGANHPSGGARFEVRLPLQPKPQVGAESRLA